MDKLKSVATLLFGVLAVSAASAHADDFISFAPLVGDFSAAHAGNEIAVPSIKDFDTNPADGYPESFGIRFDVYTAGTKTLRYSTGWRYFNRPAMPAGCTDPTNIYTEFSPKFLRRMDTTRIHAGMTSYLGCYDSNAGQFVEFDNSAIYSADVSSAAGSTWAYKLDGYMLDGVDGIDTNNDGLNDTLLVTHIYDIPGGSDTNAYVVMLNPATGAVSAPGATYPIRR